MIVALAMALSMAFPNVQARDMTGQTVHTDQQQGATRVYLIGFSHESRSETLAWRQYLNGAVGPSLKAIEMPVLSGMAVMMRPMIESAIIRKTPEAERASIQTTTDRESLIKGLGIADPDREAVIVLVDPSGKVRTSLRGGPTDANQAAFLEAWQHLARER